VADRALPSTIYSLLARAVQDRDAAADLTQEVL